jgi:uncharacterized protein YjiS (DUF1127 family)
MITSTDLDRLVALTEAARSGAIAPLDVPREPKAEMEVLPPPTSYLAYHAAHANRRIVIGRAIAAAIDAIGGLTRRAWQRYQQRRHAKLTYDALRELDDRTLHDLGLDRSEMTSIAAEVTAAAEYSRVRGRVSSQLPSV